jgi:glycine cleavage system H protein
MTSTPPELSYVKEHHWAKPNDDGTIVRVGITDFAQESLGDIVAIYLPKLNTKVKSHEACGDIESTKSDNDLVAPVAGVISSRNDAMEDSPEIPNQDPYGEGWLFEITLDKPPFDATALGLMTADEYKTFTGK